MTGTDPMPNGAGEPAGPNAACPAWCTGCGPNASIHAGERVYVGGGEGGWLGVQLRSTHAVPDDLVVKVTCTRWASSQSVELTGEKADELIIELHRLRRTMRALASANGVEGMAW